MPSIGGMFEPKAQNAIGRAWFAAMHAMNAKLGEAAKASQPAAPRTDPARALPLSAAEDVVIFRLPIDCRRYRPWQARGECKARRTPGESDKCDGISMDSLITAAARALAAGDPLAALKRVALRAGQFTMTARGAFAILASRIPSVFLDAPWQNGPYYLLTRDNCRYTYPSYDTKLQASRFEAAL
jgi:hypothetical protein